MQFLAMQGNGKTLPMIAAECYISKQTVDKTLEAARERLGARSTLQAVVRAIALELLALDADGCVTVPEFYNYLFDPAGSKKRPRAIAA